MFKVVSSSSWLKKCLVIVIVGWVVTVCVSLYQLKRVGMVLNLALIAKAACVYLIVAAFAMLIVYLINSAKTRKR